MRVSYYPLLKGSTILKCIREGDTGTIIQSSDHYVLVKFDRMDGPLWVARIELVALKEDLV